MTFDQQLLIFALTTFGASYGLIFGGGSFMVLPVLFIMGVDPKIAVATNLIAAVAQLTTGAIIFNKKKKLNHAVARKTIPFYLIGGIIGAFILIGIDAEYIKKLVSIAIILFAIFGILKRDALLNGHAKPGAKQSILGFVVLILAGAYQTAVTAGAGTLLTFILIYIFGLNLKGAIYTRQIVNLPAVAVAAAIFAYNGLVDWYLFIPLVLGRTTGALIGSQILIHSHSKRLSVIFTVAVISLAIKTLIG